jgi:hypothetical protein
VLKKQGCRPKIYVGSGTYSERGVLGRFEAYDSETLLPRYVKRALDDGYRIVHKGLLYWAPIPVAGKRFAVRALFLAIEATFSIVLWAMVSHTADYGMPHLCPWNIETLDYDGCCSHSALTEGVRDDFESATAEQIAAKELEIEQRQKEQKNGQGSCRLS